MVVTSQYSAIFDISKNSFYCVKGVKGKILIILYSVGIQNYGKKSKKTRVLLKKYWKVLHKIRWPIEHNCIGNQHSVTRISKSCKVAN